MILIFKGAWNAITNIPELMDGTGEAGDCYIIYANTPTVHRNIYDRDLGSGTKSWIAMSYIYYNGSIWDMVGATGTVTEITTTAPIVGGPITTTGGISIPKADAVTDGYLDKNDWGTFNSKQPAGDYITDLTGDVTASGPGSTAATIANNAVSYAKMQDISTTGKLLGSSSTTTPVQEISLGTNLSMSGTTLNAASSSTSPGGSTMQVQYNNASSFDGASQVLIANDENLQLLSATSLATAPSAGNTKVYSNNRTGIDEVRVSPGVGVDIPLQYSLGHKVLGMAFPINGSVVGTYHWQGFIGTTGGAANVLKSYDATNLLPNIGGVRALSAASTNATAAFQVNSTQRGIFAGNSTYGGGAKLIMTFGFPTYVSTQRVFAGYWSSAASAVANDPSSIANMIGIAKDAADGTLQLMHNDGSGTCSKTNTGITPSVNNVYRVTIFIPSNSTSMYVTLEEITKSSITVYNSGALSSNIPPAGTLMMAQMSTGTAAASVATTIQLIEMYEEQ